MIDNSTNIVLGSLRYKGSSDTNLFIDVPLEQTEKEIVEFDRNVDLSLQQVFDDERQSSSIFRPVTKYTFLFKNEYTGSTTYVPYRNNLYYTNAINNAISYATNPNTPWEGYPQYSEFDFIRVDNNIPGYTQPPNNHVTFINKSASTYNWTHYMSYAYSNDYTKPLFAIDNETSVSWFWMASDGIPFTITSGSDNNGNYITFKCPMKHGVLTGEYVEFPFDYNGETIFQVNSLGDAGFGSEEYIFNIYNVGFTGTTFQIDEVIYDNAPTYNLASYINIPENGQTDMLNFGDEYYFYGNLETDISATIYEMKYLVNLGRNQFTNTSNPTWMSGTTSYVTEIGLYNAQKDLMVISKLQSPELRQGIQQFVVKLDF